MAGYSVGAGGGDLDDLIRRAQAAAQADEQLRQKEEQRRGATEQTRGAEERSSRVRTNLAGATDQLSSALTRSTSVVGLETEAVNANTAAWTANAEARARATGATAVSGARVSAVGGTTAAAGDAGAERASLAEMQSINASLQRRSSAERRAAADAELLSQQLRIQLAQARGLTGLSTSAEAQLNAPRFLASPGGSAALLGAAGYGSLPRQPAGYLPAAGRSTTFGGPAEPVSALAQAGGDPESAARLQHMRELASENAVATGELGAQQRAANVAFQESAAAYAASSNALSRHGALTTEFIQALARGQVTLQEFGQQVTSTIGKFAGWAVAGAAVYGVVKLLDDLKKGATESQAGVQQLGRFIPGLGGPAGGGNGQIPQAYSTLRNISTEFNVPIKDVADAMSVTARVFHNLSDAGDAARAVLAAFRLDQVSIAQSEQYLLGIAQSQGQAGPGGGQWLVDKVINPLNALQAQTGARVVQTLPALARAAPAAAAGGISLPELESLVALGVRAGITGPQVGTALVRSIGTFAFRPSSELTFRKYGINPELGDYGGLVRQVTGVIDSHIARGRPLTGPDLTNLAKALGGPLLGTRTILPILAQEQLHPGAYAQSVGIAQRPRPYQEDLGAVLSGVGERFKSIGISLQAFGNELAASGALAPLTGLLDAINVLTHVIEHAVGPFTQLAGLVNELPTPLRDLLGLLVGYRVARSLVNTRFGGAAQEFVGRLPGLDAVRNQSREAVTGTQARIETYLLPEERANAERANRRLYEAQGKYADSLDELSAFTRANADVATRPLTDPRRQAYEGELSRRTRASDVLGASSGAGGRYEQEANAAMQRYAQRVADLKVLKDKQASYAERATYMEQRGYVAEESFVNVMDETLAASRARLDAIRRGVAYEGGVAGAAGGGVRGRGGSAAATAAELGATTVVAAQALTRDQGAMSSITTAVKDAQTRAGAPAAERVFYAPQSGAAAAGAPITEAERAAARAPASWTGATGLLPVGALGQVTERIAQPISKLSDSISAAGGPSAYAKGLATTALPAAPFAGILASQLIGGFGGPVGNFASNQLSSGFTGALLTQMLGKGGPAGLAAGFIGGSVLGSFQQSSSSGIGSLAGGLAGGVLGSLVPGGTLPGAAIGTTIGGFIGSLVGGSSGGSAQTDVQNQANASVQKALKDAQRNTSAMDKFGQDFTDKLEAAFTGTGASAQKAQAAITSTITQLTAEIQLFGAHSVQGQVARKQLDTVITQATRQAAFDPASAAQIIQGATQARQQVVQSQFAYALNQSSTPGGAAGAVTAANQAYDQLYSETSGAAQQQAADDLANAQGVLRQAVATGSKRIIKLAQKAVNDAKTESEGVNAMARLANEARTTAEQANAQQGFTAAQQDLASQGAVAQARQGGNQLGQLQSQHSNLNKQLTNAYTFPGLSPRDRQKAINDLDAQLTQNWTQQINQRRAVIEAQGQVAVAQTPLGDSIAQARVTLQSAQTTLTFMQSHAKAFDPTAILQMQAQVDTDRKQLVQAIADQARQLASLGSQISSARDIGNVVSQAQDILGGATAASHFAIGKVQRAQAQLDIINAQNQLHQALVDRVSAQTQLTEAEHPGDAVAQAQAAIQGAQQELAMARGTDEQIKAETALAQANQQFRQALAQRYTSLAALAASTTVDPLKQIADQIHGATQALGVTSGTDARITAQTDLNNLKLRYQQEFISQRESTIQFQLDMQQITVQQAIQQYNDLLKTRDLTRADRQQILEDIKKLQLGDYSPIGGGAGSFNLAPGNIRLPTFYDVAHAIRGARPGVNPGGSMVDASAQYTFNIEVKDSRDVPKVADALDRATGGHLRARLRAAGVR